MIYRPVPICTLIQELGYAEMSCPRTIGVSIKTVMNRYGIKGTSIFADTKTNGLNKKYVLKKPSRNAGIFKKLDSDKWR